MIFVLLGRMAMWSNACTWAGTDEMEDWAVPVKHPSARSYSVSSNGYLERILLIACNLE